MDERTLSRYSLLDDADLRLIRERRRDFNRLGFAVQLTVLRHLGRALQAGERPPEQVVSSLAGLHEVWFRWTRRDRSPMYDPLTVFATFRNDLLETVLSHAHIDLGAAEPGTVVFEPGGAGAPHRVATGLDLPGFQAMQRERLRRAVLGRRESP